MQNKACRQSLLPDLKPAPSHSFLQARLPASGTRRYLTLCFSSIPPSLLSLPRFFNLEHRILNLLKALHTALHLLRCCIVAALRVLVDIQLIVFVVAAFVLSLHHILPQDFGDRLHVLDGIVDLFGAGLESF